MDPSDNWLGVLSSVQDVITRTTTEQWPELPNGRMALSGARTDGERVYMWYGPDYASDNGAVVSFAPISLSELGAP